MSQVSNQQVKSFVANQSISAYTVLAAGATSTNALIPWNTTTANIVGVAKDNASTNGAVPVVLGGTAKCICSASVSTGALVFPLTATAGYIGEKGAVHTVTTAYKLLGTALESGSTNSVIEVRLNITNLNGA